MRRWSWMASAALAFAAGPLAAQVVAPPLVETLDSLALAHIESPIIPGVSVAVVQGDEVLLQRGYGFVDLEWDVATPDDGRASYEIGSVTKQFTGAAVLLLADEGALDLDASFDQYIDYDLQGRHVSVRRLLDHTSGIRGYTELPFFGEITPLKLPRDTLVRLIEAEPFQFEPGEALIYNNSGFFFLGLIIEAVSGQSYEDFIEERLFAPAGMTDSYYCSEARVQARRAHGYDAISPEEVIRARYLDHTWPYAAGSLCSTVADLVKWNQAVHEGDLLPEEAYRGLITAQPLEDGTPTRYAAGISAFVEGDRRVLTHGGGINGFLSVLTYYPDSRLSIAVLQNSTAPQGPGVLALALADAVLGEVVDPVEPPVTRDVSPLVGTYSGEGRGAVFTLSIEADGRELSMRVHRRDGEVGDPTPLTYQGGWVWRNGQTTLTFHPETGRIDYDAIGGLFRLGRTAGG
ncbi:MAG: serine hydrolase domain-containing protein [Gemmatimonadota bacterium]